MAKISQLPNSSNLLGDELLPIVQGTTTKKTSISDLSNNFIGRDNFVDILNEEFELGITYSQLSQGSGLIDGIFKTDGQLIFDTITEEDFEAFKAPVIREEGNWISYTGTVMGSTALGFIIINGIIWAQGGDLFGAGSFIQNSEEGLFLESVDVGLLSQKYAYFLDEGTHYHNLTQDTTGFNGNLFVYSIEVPDSATEWSEVTLTVKELQSAPTGFTGTYSTSEGQIVSVTDGIITDIS
jgi:hypothetical protein